MAKKKQKDKVFRTLMKSVREYKTPAILSPIFVMLETAIECLIPFITAQLIDNITAKRLDVIFGIAAALFACALLALTFGFSPPLTSMRNFMSFCVTDMPLALAVSSGIV